MKESWIEKLLESRLLRTHPMSLGRLFGKPQILQTAEGIREWFLAEREAHLRKEQAQELLHRFHPRVIFLKTLPFNACLLDVGAGEGSLHILREWPSPSRLDLQIYAYSLEKGQYFDHLNGYEIGHWPEEKPGFPGVEFDAVYCSHFLEHIGDRTGFITWCCDRLSADGRLYLEWPSPYSLSLPTRNELEETGIKLMISNYLDDPSHADLPAREDVLTLLVEAGFFIEQTGVIRFPFVENEILAHFATVDGYAFERLSAFWSKTYWSQYIVASKAGS